MSAVIFRHSDALLLIVMNVELKQSVSWETVKLLGIAKEAHHVPANLLSLRNSISTDDNRINTSPYLSTSYFMLRAP